MWSADFFLRALEETARTGCGYGIVKGVSSSPNAELSVTDEMPSFFLSETLKYLYLTFDENNPINSDKERNWIFTTEAHPVFTPHSSKTGNIGSQDEKWLDDARSNLLKSVDNLIASNNTASLAMRVPAKNKGRQNNTNRRLHRETWASKTGKFPHIKDLQNLSTMRSLKDTANRQKPLSSWRRGAIGRILDHTLSLTGANADETAFYNFALLTHGRNGRGSSLSQSCPNYHQSNALWIQAIMGEDLDYAESFESTLSNDEHVLITKRRVLSPLTASALLGTSYLSPAQNRCRSQSKKTRRVEPNDDSPEKGTQRIDMGGKLGAFDISVEQSGVGYHVKHVNSGESIEVTIAQSDDGDDESDEGAFIAVDSLVRAGETVANNRVGLLNQIKSVFTLNDTGMKKRRHVMIADLKGNSYECKVELKQEISEISDEETKHVEKSHKLIATFPCLSASYGPTSIEALNASGGNGVTIEALLFKPDKSDPFGCHEDWDLDEDMKDPCQGTSLKKRKDTVDTLQNLQQKLDMRINQATDASKPALDNPESRKNSNLNKKVIDYMKESINSCPPKKPTASTTSPRVQLVNRGHCNFREKGTNLAERFNARGLIVMNTEQRRLFIMAGPLKKSLQMSNTEEPLSVLVTKDDGSEMTTIIDQYATKNIPIIASIRIIPRSSQASILRDASSSNKHVKWPVIMSSPGNVQVHSKGWGVGAVREKDVWQIMLLDNEY